MYVVYIPGSKPCGGCESGTFRSACGSCFKVDHSMHYFVSVNSFKLSLEHRCGTVHSGLVSHGKSVDQRLGYHCAAFNPTVKSGCVICLNISDVG